MSYEGTDGKISAVYQPASATPGLGAGSMLFVARGAMTRRQYGLFRRNLRPRAGGPDPHFHRTFSEAFYVLSGTVGLYDGRGWQDAEAGDFLYVPKGGIHAFRNDSDKPASVLIVFAPGYARERYFTELDAISRSGRQLSDQEWTDLWARHDQFMVP